MKNLPVLQLLSPDPKWREHQSFTTYTRPLPPKGACLPTDSMYVSLGILVFNTNWVRKPLSFTVWVIIKEQRSKNFFFPVSSPTSCISSLLALSTRYFGHQPACLSSHRHLSIATHMHPNNISSATIHLNLPVNDNQQRDVPHKSFQLPHQQKWCFWETFLPSFSDRRMDQIKPSCFSPEEGAGRRRMWRHTGKTHARPVFDCRDLQSGSRRHPASFFLTFCSLF